LAFTSRTVFNDFKIINEGYAGGHEIKFSENNKIVCVYAYND
jgi:hypothetical protein